MEFSHIYWFHIMICFSICFKKKKKKKKGFDKTEPKRSKQYQIKRHHYTLQANHLASLHKYLSNVYLKEPVSQSGGIYGGGSMRKCSTYFLQSNAIAATATCMPHSTQWNSMGVPLKYFQPIDKNWNSFHLWMKKGAKY